ncbi:MAG: precorrin-2 C(20)-methyltransferase [Candidatus Aquicultor secundus]|uniref:Precorrin-2 C(20)-methyltransferase n=1 Tax=Candidatus Aquicultor secundus TaxID=1973895 RepID=A0A2M7TB90_9ACTN|nr:precorrin-2 C(20)-methyltransferase [Candidatus Aquicultor secundus]NCO66742.1 precorrin-2 C(20)-methyltransferase [Solirubrobacter sp.]OIO83778.1 MAG: precorrin-2 C(20)-methyltransferase [Candidatus Aquicultor secundus]PIU27916.1 MAG: precorrin-2 C(20)-methyltransferase [Candidatus Aquicultor secundus]PIW21741.1 MAG: precorrin-2 C(20)-methyltransferase [Candidatus Aquicultor secundus]PIX51803.1 MAG: precorrin-2 C(20)-methyltransferase [Candidatus Aquicultor secundus]
MASQGRLYGIGIGPGDTQLLTLKSVEVLNSVDVIFTPRSAPKRNSIARKIIEPALKGKAQIIELTFPMTKDKGELESHWSTAAAEVAGILREGKNAAFVTLGDPFFYSTYIYLYNKLKEEYPEADIITLPGISSAFASASAAGVPIAIGDEKLAIIPLPRDTAAIRPYLEMFDTVIILKVGEKLRGLIDVLTELGLQDNAVLVQKVSQKGSERIITGLSGLSEAELDEVGYLSTVMVKKNM